MTVYDLIHNSLVREAERTETDGQEMVRRIMLEMQQRRQMQKAAPPAPDGT